MMNIVPTHMEKCGMMLMLMTEAEAEAKGYMFRVMQTETRLSEYSYYPALKAALRAASKAASDSHLSKEHYGDRLIFDDEYITCEKDSYFNTKKQR